MVIYSEQLGYSGVSLQAVPGSSVSLFDSVVGSSVGAVYTRISMLMSLVFFVRTSSAPMDGDFGITGSRILFMKLSSGGNRPFFYVSPS